MSNSRNVWLKCSDLVFVRTREICAKRSVVWAKHKRSMTPPGTPRAQSPPRETGSSGVQEPVTPQRGSPQREPSGNPTVYGPPGFIPEPLVRGEGNPSADSNGASGFSGTSGRVPLGVLHKGRRRDSVTTIFFSYVFRMFF